MTTGEPMTTADDIVEREAEEAWIAWADEHIVGGSASNQSMRFAFKTGFRLRAQPATPREEGEPPWFHHHNRHPWLQPGDRPDRVWILRFDDRDMREMLWTDADAEVEACKAYTLYSPTWNCTLLATATAPTPSSTVTEEAVERAARAHNSYLAGSPAEEFGWEVMSSAARHHRIAAMRAALQALGPQPTVKGERA